jgi:diguanylate cyclase (GGDEF)-like protein
VLDIRTLMITTGITSLMLGAIMFLTVRNYVGNSRAAMQIWAWGQGVQPVGWFLIALRQQIPDVLSIVVGNLVVVAGFNACIHALDVFGGRRARHEIFIALVLLNFVVTMMFTYWLPPTQMREVGLSLVMILIFLFATQAVLAVAGPNGRRPPSHWITAGVFGIGVPVMVARIVARLIDDQTGSGGAFAATRVEQVVYAYTSFVNIVASFGFVLMCNDRFNAELARLAAEDPLTGVFNRRTFEQHALTAFDRARRDVYPLALLMIDGDHFKRINDEHGHAAGDAALRIYARTFRNVLRPDDAIGRVGGEEFSALLPQCDENEACALGERLRAAIEANVFQHEGRSIPLRVSVGVAAVDARGEDDFEALQRRADRALYAAKHTGRNRVVAASAAVSV